jgi:hypothetical protein
VAIWGLDLWVWFGIDLWVLLLGIDLALTFGLIWLWLIYLGLVWFGLSWFCLSWVELI